MVGIFPPEDRPFRLYRGCLLMLRGKDVFHPREARNFPARNIRGNECGWIGQGLDLSPKWYGLLRAPIYAVLLNNVPPDDKIVWCSEENVEIIPLNNPVIMERLEIGLHMLKEHLIKDQLEEVQSDLEQSAFLSETGRFNLPLKSVFIPKSPKVEMTDYQPPYNRRDPRREIPSSWHLNSSQINAATQLLKFRFSMVVGPPGTGKTQTIVASSLFLTQFAEIPLSRMARLAS
jgi:hypothetical protein